jgi:hypothetical protein
MQPDLISNLLWIPVITLLLYVPLVCYLDIKYREVDHYWWLGFVLINIPVYFALLTIGIYQWWMCLFSFLGVVIYFIMMKLHYIEGADFVFISMILIFLQFNPVTQHWFMTIPFSILLVGCLGVCGIWLLVKNISIGKGISFEVENGFPMMIPISSALVLVVMLV